MSSLFRALAQFPSLLQLFETLAFWILDETKAVRAAKLEKNLNLATDLAKAQKDTSKLDQLLKGD